MTHEIVLNRQPQNILASANQHGVSIYIGWTVGIPVDRAIEYAQSYNTKANYGFCKVNDDVILFHDTAKLTLTKQEAKAIIDLIKTTYGVSGNS